MTTTNGLILMTALPPTIGHKYLIDFALRCLNEIDRDGELNVIICSRDREPITGEQRIDAFEEVFAYAGSKVNFLSLHGEVPQDPSEDPNFWDTWKNLINNTVKYFVSEEDNGVVFASDHYGKDLANALGYEFIPCNTYREVVKVSATQIRHDPIRYFANILPEFQPVLKRTVTIFGAESTGKTTMSKLLAENMNGYYVPEWAREYMEVLQTTTVTDELMERVMQAQYASEASVDAFKDKPFVFRDTDLLSTIGYWRIWGKREPKELAALFNNYGKADLYVLMNDMIPFTPDPLRFGGDKRESTNSFWINLLKEYGCNYHIVHSSYRERQEEEITTVVRNDFLNNGNGLGMFLRTNQEPYR